MQVLKKIIGQPWKIVEIENSLQSLQNEVGGFIETVIFENAAVICDEDGRFKQKQYNTSVCGISFVGDILLVGIKNNNGFCDLPYINTFENLLNAGRKR